MESENQYKERTNRSASLIAVKPCIPYVVPFIIFAILTCIGPLLDISRIVIYPIKTVLVALSLVFFLNDYKKEIKVSFSWLPIISGIFVFLIWVMLEGWYPQLGHPIGFDPHGLTSGHWIYFAIAFRLASASLVVPVMEELFWRSFAMRFVTNFDFRTIPLGSFSWLSFIFISLLFGLEHHRWLPGVVAGMVYAVLLYRKKNLFDPILSHAVTNFLLGIYVLSTGKWFFW